jgi:DNA mismatch repair ATPase MutS
MGDMFQLYAEAYKHHSAKYGADTAIFYLVGSFYELYDWEDPKTGDYQTSMRRAVDLMGLKLVPKPKAAPKKADGVSAGFKEDVVHKFASMLTRANWTVVIYDQVKNGKGDVTERRAVRVLSPGTHVETASIESVYMGSLWLEEGAWGSQQPPTFGAAALDLTTGRITTYEGSAVGKADSWMADDVFHFFQVHAPRECIVWWKEAAYRLQKRR